MVSTTSDTRPKRLTVGTIGKSVNVKISHTSNCDEKGDYFFVECNLHPSLSGKVFKRDAIKHCAKVAKAYMRTLESNGCHVLSFMRDHGNYDTFEEHGASFFVRPKDAPANLEDKADYYIDFWKHLQEAMDGIQAKMQDSVVTTISKQVAKKYDLDKKDSEHVTRFVLNKCKDYGGLAF